jgi:anti-sigma B factor antagonist
VHVKLKVRKAGRATILDFEGALKLGDGEEAVRGQIQQLLDGGATRVALNLGKLAELDSSGIGVLMRSYASLNRAGGKCAFYGVSGRVLMLLKMVRLDTVLDIVEDEGAALSRL